MIPLQDRRHLVELIGQAHRDGASLYKACETAVLSHGGMGYSREFHVERYLREAMLTRIAPISPQLILSFIAEKALGLPKSY